MFSRRPLRDYLIILGFLATWAALACYPAQGQMDHSSMDSHVGWVPQELLDRPVPLRTGIGTIHEEVSTSSKQAQAFYDQGLAYLQSYVWIEAARSFHQALRSDPKLAMAYVGLSYAYSPMDFRAAEAALTKARSLAANATDRERRRMDIRSLQLRAMVDPSKLERELAFRDALDDALAAYPDDTVFLLLRGVAAEPSPFADGQGCDIGCVPYFEKVLTLDPNNFAAQHFLAHCYENTGQVQQALPHAIAYADLAPDIPHAQHMCGHVLRRAGQMDQAIARFQRADDLERAYFRAEKISPSLDWHHAHNLSLLASSYQYLGQVKDAEKYFREGNALPAYTDYNSFNHKDWPEFLLNRRRYPEALAAARAMVLSKFPLARAVGHVLAGDALLCMNRAKEAAAELDEATRIMQPFVPGDVATMRPYVDGLRGALLVNGGETAKAASLFQLVIRRIQAANGPDAWTQGLFQIEFLCDVVRRENDWALAGQLARALDERASDYAGSHYALALVAQHDGDSETAAGEFSTAAKLWNQADPDLPELAEAHKALAAHNP